MAEAQPGIWISDPKAYQDKLNGLLAGRNPIEVMEETPGVLAGIVKENSAEVMRTRPFRGKWSPNEILGHLTDAEWVFGFRVRIILCEDNPAILGMDHDLWVSGLKHNDRDPAKHVEMFKNLREGNLIVWRTLGPAELARTCRHNERGTEQLGLIMRMEAGHDLSHIDQINRYLAAIRNA